MRLALFLCATLGASGQVIDFESGGLHYQTLTKAGVTVMFAHLPNHIREYSMLQIAVSNGSKTPFILKLDDFLYIREDGVEIRPEPARKVVGEFMDKAGRTDVIKLVQTYELAIYGLSRIKSTNGYEQRRQAAFANVNSQRLKAAAAASAIVLVQTKLVAGETTDGAIFFTTGGKPIGAGRLIVHTNGQTYEFHTVGGAHGG